MENRTQNERFQFACYFIIGRCIQEEEKINKTKQNREFHRKLSISKRILNVVN